MNTQMKFADLQLDGRILQAIAEAGYETPTPIQQKSIPHLLEGKDLLGCAQTGTGKTAAFALPILERLLKNPKRLEPKTTRVLVLSPTRELAVQIHESFLQYSKFARIRTACVFGGVGQGLQIKSTAQGVDVLVATPGRLLDLIQQRHINITKIDVFVLDEADRMLDMGFLPDIRKVINLLPKQRQSLFFSATMPKDILGLANSLLTDPVKVEVTPVASTAELINQSVMFVDKNRKKDLLVEVLRDNSLHKVIVFCRTKHGANKVSETLVKLGIDSDAIHGNKSQNARQRAIENLRTGRTRVLVATDIAARGIDIDGISHVINYELPNEPESYVHRIGRTARAGSSGAAISFCDAEEKAYLRDIERLIGKQILVNDKQKYHSQEVMIARIMSKGKAKAAIEGRGGDKRMSFQKKKRFFGARNGDSRSNQSDSRRPRA